MRLIAAMLVLIAISYGTGGPLRWRGPIYEYNGFASGNDLISGNPQG
jgi:hypothetical protein